MTPFVTIFVMSLLVAVLPWIADAIAPRRRSPIRSSDRKRLSCVELGSSTEPSLPRQVDRQSCAAQRRSPIFCSLVARALAAMLVAMPCPAEAKPSPREQVAIRLATDWVQAVRSRDFEKVRASSHFPMWIEGALEARAADKAEVCMQSWLVELSAEQLSAQRQCLFDNSFPQVEKPAFVLRDPKLRRNMKLALWETTAAFKRRARTHVFVAWPIRRIDCEQHQVVVGIRFEKGVAGVDFLANLQLSDCS